MGNEASGPCCIQKDKDVGFKKNGENDEDATTVAEGDATTVAESQVDGLSVGPKRPTAPQLLTRTYSSLLSQRFSPDSSVTCSPELVAARAQYAIAKAKR
jgi:hypothetical protein